MLYCFYEMIFSFESNKKNKQKKPLLIGSPYSPFYKHSLTHFFFIFYFYLISSNSFSDLDISTFSARESRALPSVPVITLTVAAHFFHTLHSSNASYLYIFRLSVLSSGLLGELNSCPISIVCFRFIGDQVTASVINITEHFSDFINVIV